MRAGQRITHPQHHPPPWRRSPLQPPIGLHLGGQIERVLLTDGIRGRNTRRGGRVQIGRRGKGGFLLEAVHAGIGVQGQFGHLEIGRRHRGGGRCRERHAKESRRGSREGDGPFDPAAPGHRRDVSELCPIVAGLQFRAARRHHGERANRLRAGEFELDPSLLARRRGRKRAGLGQIAIGQRGELEVAAA